MKRAAYREGLKAHRAEALLSKQLVTLREDVPVALDLDALRLAGPDAAAAHALFKELEFQVLAREYAPEVAPLAAEQRLARDAGRDRRRGRRRRARRAASRSASS